MLKRFPHVPFVRPVSRHCLKWALVLLIGCLGMFPARASFHLWDFTEAYSNADGSVQFVELFTAFNSEQFTANRRILSISADGSMTNVFTFPGNTPSPTANHFLLLATPGFESQPGGITPDFVIPTQFLFTGGGTLDFVGADTMSYLALPTDGTQSVGPGGLNAVNSPSNFGGETGQIEVGMEIENPIADLIAKGDLVIELEVVASGLASPLGMAVPDDGEGRAYIYDQTGYVYILDQGVLLPEPFLVVTNRLVEFRPGFDERGFLGLAFHPNFAEHPFLYTYTSEPLSQSADFTTTLPAGESFDHQSVIAEWRVDAANANAVDPASRRELMRIDQPQFNHDGGALRFGPDGFLYIALGDGGGADDQGSGHGEEGNGQNIENVYGTILRINVDGSDSANGQYGIPADNPMVGGAGLDEIFAYGLRNPFSFSFDALEGDLYVGDVGQNDIEELDIVVRGGNYGWPIKEGSFFFDPNGANQGILTTVPVRPVPPDLIDPIAEYDHDDGLSIIGGFVYRGTRVPGLYGRYVTGDFQSPAGSSGRLFYVDGDGQFKEFRIGAEDREMGLFLKGFGQDEDGEIYVMASSARGPEGTGGQVLKIVSAAEPVVVAGSALTEEGWDISWTGGTGPFTMQKQLQAGNATWMNVQATHESSSVLPLEGPSGFVRIADEGLANAIPFTALMYGAAARPNPVTTDGGGFGTFVLEGHRLTFTIGYTNLSAPASAAHIHGPAPASEPAGVMIDLEPFALETLDVAGTFAGSVILNDTQREAVLQGRTYVNVHTPNHTSGEIRGQIAPVVFEAALSGAAERPTPISTDGGGAGLFFLVGSTLSFQVDFSELSSIVQNAHIHGPATVHESEGVMVGLASYNGGSFSTEGRLAGTLDLSPDQLAALVDGLTYVNVHTALRGSGEIRGQILPRPTATPLSASLSGDAERPSPVETEGRGNGMFTVEGNLLTFHIEYSGLSGPASDAHIHGPADTESPAGVMIGLGDYAIGTLGASGVFSGTVPLSEIQKAHLLGGRTYVNVHTDAHGSGEIRGQIARVSMKSSLNGASARPNPVDTPAQGFGLHLLVGDRLQVNLHYRDLTGEANNAHIHGPADTEATAGVLVGLNGLNGGAFGTTGRLWGAVGLDPDQLGLVIDAQTYINIHTPLNGSGEIRGQLTP